MRPVIPVLVLGLLFASFPSVGGGHVGLRVANSGKLEHVEIRAATPVDLSGWTLASSVGSQSYRFGAARIGGGGMLRVVSGTTPAGRGDVAWTRQNVWNNEGDVAMLFDQRGALVAEYSYGRVKAKSPAKVSSAKKTKAKR